MHMQNILPGDIPLEWLQEQDSFISLQCHQIVVLALIPRSAVGQSEALGLLEYQLPPPQPLLTMQGISEGSAPEASLPSFEAVCHLQCATIRHIPQKARPSFARVLSDSLRSVCVSNSEEAWLKLFMLPKCVLRASLQGGHKHKSHSIEELCRLWSDGHLASLWQYASDHSGSPTPNHQRRKQKAKFSLQSTRPEKVYWERRARFSPLLGLPPIPLTCYSKSIPRVQFHHVRKSHYHQKVSGCLQT